MAQWFSKVSERVFSSETKQLRIEANKNMNSGKIREDTNDIQTKLI
jgi:hypothetical protein